MRGWRFGAVLLWETDIRVPSGVPLAGAKHFTSDLKQAYMCGIAGYWNFAADSPADALEGNAAAMANAIRHRGPDGCGTWADPAAGLALGHRRLSIIDLSDAGRQPMASASGRTLITYNGEVYNAPEIRRELEARHGIAFRGHSDTEVVLEACEAWGVEKAAKAFVGMFAFALWDREARALTLVRDRLGIKPLYWGRQGNRLFFASELKSLFAHPDWSPELDRAALTGFVNFNYVPAPRSIFSGIRKLEPGCLVTVTADEERPGRYWDLFEVVRQARADPLDLDDTAAADALEALLGDAVERRMVADVPLGAFLSGGIDSSVVVALMQARGSGPVKTFSIGFDEQGFDEAQHAKAVARHLGTEHHEQYVSPGDALDVIPGLAGMYDEPFADSSQIPTHLVSRLARRDVAVSLSGDGGDELFTGYNRYNVGVSLWRRIALAPRPLRRAAAAMILAVPPRAWDAAAARLPLRSSRVGDKAHKLAAVLNEPNSDAFYQRLVRFWDDAASVVVGGQADPAGLWSGDALRSMPDFTERMQFIDTLTYLPDDILTKVDRASMAVSLEARVPILDHRVVEFAWRLPRHHKIRDGQSKWLLRQVLYRHVPRELVDRPKMGFGVPVGMWLRGPLRDWAEDLLSRRALLDTGLFNPDPVRRRWREHLGERRNWEYSLWGIAMAQAWHRHWLGTGRGRPA